MSYSQSGGASSAWSKSWSLETVAILAPAFASSSCGIPVGPLHSFTYQSPMKPSVSPVQSMRTGRIYGGGDRHKSEHV